MVKWAGEEKRFQPLPKFPAVYRDLSVVVDKAMEAERVMETIEPSGNLTWKRSPLRSLSRTAYPEGKKGISYRIRYQANDRTLTDEEVNQYHERSLRD